MMMSDYNTKKTPLAMYIDVYLCEEQLAGHYLKLDLPTKKLVLDMG